MDIAAKLAALLDGCNTEGSLITKPLAPRSPHLERSSSLSSGYTNTSRTSSTSSSGSFTDGSLALGSEDSIIMSTTNGQQNGLDNGHHSSSTVPSTINPSNGVSDISNSSPSEGDMSGSFILMSPTINPQQAHLLAALDEANRLLEADQKSKHSLPHSTPNSKQSSIYSGHSRNPSRTSMSSILSNTSVNSIQLEEQPVTTDEAWHIWGKIVNSWESVIKKKSQYVKELVRSGIPQPFRGVVWPLLVNAHAQPLKEQYAEFLKQTSPSEKVIRRDVTRTYPEHELFKEKNGLGQESLFNVMKAYSLYDREVGYCQGSGFIVGLLLMEMPEEEAFAVLVKMMNDLNLRELFKPNMTELGLCMYQLECLIQDTLPSLYAHFQAQNFNVSMFASSWFLTLFTTGLHLSVASRVFDVFFSEGMEIIFRVGLAILILNHDDLLALDMEGMLQYIQKIMPTKHEEDPDKLINTCFQVKYSSKKMKKLEKEYSTLKTKEQEEQVELRRLRTENRLLRQRIDNLEKETATLADRLIQDQVKHAHKVEEVFVLRRDLCTIRDHDSDTAQKLDDVTEQLRLSRQQSRPDSAVSNGSTESQQEEKVQSLEKTVTQLKDTEQELRCTINELRSKIGELENSNEQLQREPSVEIQTLQEELIACKLREAEASLGMKEMQQRVYEMEKAWQRHMEKYNIAGQAPTNNKDKAKKETEQLANELMTVRLREGRAISELKEHKQRVMELETQNQISNRQIKRLDDEKDKLKEELEKCEDVTKELNTNIKENERKWTNMETNRKEESMMAKIKDAEHSQSIAEMRQRIAELEIENQELVTTGQLDDRNSTMELEDKVAELREQVLRLKMSNRRLSSLSSLHNPYDDFSDYDTDDTDNVLTGSSAYLNLAHMSKSTELSIDSSEGEGLYDYDSSTVKRRSNSHKSKNQNNHSDDYESYDADLLPTPTNHPDKTLVQSNELTNNCDKQNYDDSDIKLNINQSDSNDEQSNENTPRANDNSDEAAGVSNDSALSDSILDCDKTLNNEPEKSESSCNDSMVQDGKQKQSEGTGCIENSVDNSEKNTAT